ncbi:hypothetical protein BpHYR1_045852 [Brachionus plicatilis]|uniref:Uncharacterized protein n=1 Tax=Brachionus plicatilis TaxID=10195 RepID=A0A3M7RBN6_BRAPC|nr:hypothetical protein BpHYR1_045852 [Brachionus plicatilis]
MSFMETFLKNLERLTLKIIIKINYSIVFIQVQLSDNSSTNTSSSSPSELKSEQSLMLSASDSTKLSESLKIDLKRTSQPLLTDGLPFIAVSASYCGGRSIPDFKKKIQSLLENQIIDPNNFEHDIQRQLKEK